MMSTIDDGSCRGRGLDSAERAAKRHRSGSDGDNDGGGEQLPLPPEVWAAVMAYVPFETVLSCAATCRSMLHDSCKLLTRLRIDTSWQLNLAVVSRFRDVREVHINSLLRENIEEEGTIDEMREVTIDWETKNRVVPYLSHFSKLERVYFGVKDGAGDVLKNFDVADHYYWAGDDPYPDDGDRERLLQFIDSISAGFRCGALSKRLKISGLCCPDAVDRGGFRSRMGHCETCSEAARSFPLESVLSFECRGSSSSRALSGRPFGLDVCLEQAQLESIIESRPGGHKLLRSEERLLGLLGKARRYKIDAIAGEPLYIVKHSYEDLGEIERIIRYADLDVKNFSTQKVIAAIKISLAKDGNAPPLPYNRCYVSHVSIDYLKDTIGFDIAREDFERPLIEMVLHAKQIAWVLIHAHILNNGDTEYLILQSDCLYLIRRFMEEIEVGPPIDHKVIADADAKEIDQVNQMILPAIADAIPSIVQYLDFRCGKFHADASSILKNILIRGTEHHRNLIVDAGAISSFSRLLRSSKESVAIDSVTSLSIIVTAGNDEYIKKASDTGGIAENLAYVIESRGCDHVVEKCLTILTAIKQTLPLHHLVRFIQSPDGTCVLANCSAILRQMIESDSPPIQNIIDSGVLPRLAKVIKTTDDCITQMNLAHVMRTISSSNKRAADLWEEMILFFIGLQDSSCEATAEKATSTLNDIASVGAGRWVSWKEQSSLRWGEFVVKGELVDSDEESDTSFEEAEETDNAQLELEVMQSVVAANVDRAQLKFEVMQSVPAKFDHLLLITSRSPTLMGMSDSLLEKILHFVRVSEVTLLEGVCKRFHCVSTRNNEFWEHHPGVSAKTRKEAREMHGLRQIRRFQKTTFNHILDVLATSNIEEHSKLSGNPDDKANNYNGDGDNDGDDDDEAGVFRTLCSNLLSHMIHLNDGPAVHFRLRGDTIYYLSELMQAFMVEKLSQALLMAIHNHRTTVQYEDIQFVFRNIHYTFHSSSNDSEEQIGNIGDPENSDCSCSIASGIVWHWPGDDFCYDVLPPESGRRIIRALAYQAGINKMTNDAFLLAEAEMLHTMGTLLVDAFESSVDMAKSASFLEADVTLVYKKPIYSDHVPPCLAADLIDDPCYSSSEDSDCSSTGSGKVKLHDMFKVPPPPFVSREDPEKETIYTIVPGQIADSAEERNIGPNNVYGCGQDGWVTSPGFTQEEEWEIEESYYYTPYDDGQQPITKYFQPIQSIQQSD